MNTSPTLDAIMLANAASNPGAVAWIDIRGTLSQGELALKSYLLSTIIRQTTQAERVAVCLPGIKEYPIAVFACLLAGKTVAPINFLLPPAELMHILKDSGADCCITSSHFVEKLAPLGLNLLKIEDLAASAAGVDLSQIKPQPASDANEVAILLYTSGTTAVPNGVQLTHANLIAQRDAFAGILKLEELHVLCALPLFHTFALSIGVILPGISPVRATLLPTFDPVQVVQTLKADPANVLLGVPSMYRLIGRVCRKLGLNAKDLGLTFAIAGGEKLPDEVRAEFEASLGIPLHQGYGLTEHSPVVTLNIPNANKPGTIGRPIPGVQIRLMKDDGSLAAVGEEGELQVFSASVMRGYNSTTNQPFTADGWLKTGDLAVADEDGYFSITGRSKELIISAGKNIHPGEIEEVVLTHEAIDHCAVIGIPDKTRGEAPAVFCVLKEGQALAAEQLQAWINEHVPEYRKPRLVRILDQMPLSPTGKVHKRMLKDMLARENG